MSFGGESWDALKLQAKKLQAQLETRVQELRAVHSQLSSAPGGDHLALLEEQKATIAGARAR